MSQDKVIWTATIDGTPIGRLQIGSGAEIAATGHKAWNRGDGEEERGGRKSTTNVTLRRENDGNPSIPWLVSKINRPVRVHRTPADADENPRMAEQMAWNGKLLAVRFDDTDTMNEGDVEMWEIECGLNTP